MVRSLHEWDAYQPDLVEAATFRAFGDGPSGSVPAGASMAARLLGLTGRRP